MIWCECIRTLKWSRIWQGSRQFWAGALGATRYDEQHAKQYSTNGSPETTEQCNSVTTSSNVPTDKLCGQQTTTTCQSDVIPTSTLPITAAATAGLTGNKEVQEGKCMRWIRTSRVIHGRQQRQQLWLWPTGEKVWPFCTYQNNGNLELLIEPWMRYWHKLCWFHMHEASSRPHHADNVSESHERKSKRL